MGAKALGSCFSLLGFQIASFKKTSVAIALLLWIVALVGLILRANVTAGFESGFVRADAPSNDEVRAHRHFFGDKGKPWYMVVFAIARGDGNMVAEEEYDEMRVFYRDITEVLSITVPYHNSTVVYKDLCGIFCDFNDLFFRLMNMLWLSELRYPVAKIFGYDANIGKFIFDREVDEDGVVTSAKMVALYFTTFVNSTLMGDRLVSFERELKEIIAMHNANSSHKVEFLVHGAETVKNEVIRGAKMMAPIYIIGGATCFVLALASVFVSSKLYDQLNAKKAAVFVAALLVPAMAATASLGTMCALGLALNMPILLSPFLVVAFAVGLNDAFLLSTTWMRLSSFSTVQEHSFEKRLGLVFERVGSTVVLKSFVNALGFGVAMALTVPEIKLLCLSIALQAVFELFFQFFFFAPILALSGQDKYESYEKPGQKEHPEKAFRHGFEKAFLNGYCSFLTTPWSLFLAVLVLSIGYLAPSIHGVQSLRSEMDGRWLLPPDSRSMLGVDIMSDTIWPDQLSILYIIRRPPNFEDPIQYTKFKAMVADIEAMEQTVGHETNMMWLIDYLKSTGVSGGLQAVDSVNMSSFKTFITTDPYQAWQTGVRFSFDEERKPSIKQMLFMVTYNGTHTMTDKLRLLTACRQMVQKYPEFDVKPFDTDSDMVDVIAEIPRSIKVVSASVIGATGIAFFAISLNFTASLLTMAASASLFLGVAGFLPYWNVEIDPLSMGGIIITPAFCVTFCAPLILHFLKHSSTTNNSTRLRETFKHIGLPSLQASLCILVVLLPVLFAPIVIYANIAKAVTLVVLFGILHGFFIVPTLLVALPRCLLGTNCCCELNQDE
ncbi:hypothetical protein QR680_017771 [Steinernema hermaphroditum]|uniref:SSD domain-containing protein n=1 Tax=Steinernema hermaphroditum TaxID=289476 RepID=A0AA39LPZ2_9BILA|nr:hypothetical protein QR680_017771 [Steinernema hermaphroditum]